MVVMQVFKLPLPSARPSLPPLAVPRRAQASSAAASTASKFAIRSTVLAEELREAAQLRAEAYYENQSHGRFTKSFIRQFAEQEARSLEQRCATGGGGGGRPECVTLVAHATTHPAHSCVGTLDVRPPAAAGPGGRWPEGVPAGATAAAYALNVVVAEGWRGRGLGRALVAAAKRLAREEWQAVQLYAHVDSINEAALALYLKCGFESVAVEGGVCAGSIIGQRQLLRCELR